LWLHFLDPHKWYIFHPGFKTRFGNRSIDRYDHEIAFTDHHVGVVLDGLKKEGLKDNTAIIITSDHGEAFGEHRTAFHGFSIYDVELRVPLLLSVPGHRKAQRISARRSLIDLTPTILDLAQVTAPHRLQGQSWLADLEGTALQDRIIYAERPKGPHSAGMRALIEGEWKIIWLGRGNRYELYNLDADPGELKDRFKQRPQVAKRMVAALVAMQRVALDNQGKVSSR
jgi:arylsulfatase A-like enzyme